MFPLVSAHLYPALVLFGQKHKGPPLADSALPRSCTTENPELKLSRRPFSPGGRLCHSLPVPWPLPTAPTSHSHYVGQLTPSQNLMLLFQACIRSRTHVWGQVHLNDLLPSSCCLFPRVTSCFCLILLHLDLPPWFNILLSSQSWEPLPYSTLFPPEPDPFTIDVSLEWIRICSLGPSPPDWICPSFLSMIHSNQSSPDSGLRTGSLLGFFEFL